jgi:hypothetical protein
MTGGRSYDGTVQDGKNGRQVKRGALFMQERKPHAGASLPVKIDYLLIPATALGGVLILVVREEELSAFEIAHELQPVQ